MDGIKQGLTGAVERRELAYPILRESTYVAGEWRHECGTALLAKHVHHSIHDGPFPLTGSGQVHVEVVPYCPTCGPEPSSYGAPING